MQLSELLRAISVVAQTGGTAAVYEALGREAERLADMVGWANGPIDPNGQLLERLASLQDDLSVRHAQTQEATLLLLHDALTGLGRAIARHDEDLNRDGDGGEDGEDLM